MILEKFRGELVKYGTKRGFNQTNTSALAQLMVYDEETGEYQQELRSGDPHKASQEMCDRMVTLSMAELVGGYVVPPTYTSLFSSSIVDQLIIKGEFKEAQHHLYNEFFNLAGGEEMTKIYLNECLDKITNRKAKWISGKWTKYESMTDEQKAAYDEIN